ncbi:MAG: glycerophosphodiester phosphodiesterase [Dehalococcoidia bacterium]
MNSGKPPLRIAHAFGNHREEIRRALSAPLDMIEADIWLRGDRAWVRHERRLGPTPLLADRRMPGHTAGRLALPIWPRYYIRPDLDPLSLDELLDSVGGRRRLLLDIKGDDRPVVDEGAVAGLARRLTSRGVRENVAACGQNWTLLSRLREIAPELEVRYSIETPQQWARFLDMPHATSGVCMERRLINEERVRVLTENGLSVYCWTVDDQAEAQRLLAAGVDGIISNRLGLLASLERASPPAA